jgi:glutamate-ammonia-ligase adenylyltransferase
VGKAAADAYREMRRLQHRARLNEDPTALPAGQLIKECNAVLALWRGVMN